MERSYSEFLQDVDYWVSECSSFYNLPIAKRILDDEVGFLGVFEDNLLRRGFYSIADGMSTSLDKIKLISIMGTSYVKGCRCHISNKSSGVSWTDI